MVGLGETYVPAFALAVDLGEVIAGLVATVPMLAGACFQLATPFAVRRLGSYRRWVVLCARLQALSFVPLLAGAALGRIDVAWLVLSAISYWAFGMATGPAWNTWVTTLVPPEIRAHFFAHRARSCQAALLGAMLCAGLLLELGGRRGSALDAFALLFAAAMAARFVSAGYLARQSETAGLAVQHRALPLDAVVRSVREAGATRVLVYLIGMQTTVHFASPWFTPYMLGPLELSYGDFMALTGIAFLSRVLVLPVLGRIAHHRGTRTLLWWGAVGIVPLPVLWLVSDSLIYLLGLQICAGAAWAALELATTLSFFEGIPERDRASVLSAFNLVSALGIALGALVSSQLFVWLDGSRSSYAWLFAISAAGRLGTLALLRPIRPARRVAEGLRFRTLAVRPSAGAVERPILASVEAESATEPEPPGS